MPEEQYMLRQSYRGSTYAKSSSRGWTSPLLHLTHKICCGKNYYYKFSQPTCDFFLKLDTYILLVIQLQTQQSGCLVYTRHHNILDTCSSQHSLHSPLRTETVLERKLDTTHRTQLSLLCGTASIGTVFPRCRCGAEQWLWLTGMCVCWPSWRRVVWAAVVLWWWWVTWALKSMAISPWLKVVCWCDWHYLPKSYREGML